MPFLGICRGMQILNVTFGGDLLQSIDTDPLHAKFEQMEELAHPVRIVPGSKLSQMGVPDEFMVNSAHHQAVGTLGQGLTVEATAEDGGEAKVPVGSFIQPHNFNRWFKDFCADNGFGRYTKNARTITRAGRTLVRGNGYEGIKPHSLRHTQGTLLIGNGVDVKTVQARPGHSDPGLTLRQYTRALSENDAAATELFDELLEASAAPGRDVSR